MNITKSIAENIGDEFKDIILSNTEIQFYINANLIEYQWKDSRYKETSDVWKNPTGATRGEVMNIFKEHIKNHTN